MFLIAVRYIKLTRQPVLLYELQKTPSQRQPSVAGCRLSSFLKYFAQEAVCAIKRAWPRQTRKKS